MESSPCDEQEVRRPFDLDKASAAKDINAYLNFYVTTMDTKATAFLAGNVGAATFLLQKLPAAGWQHSLFFVAAALFAASALVTGGVIFPRLPLSGNSIIFWGDIAKQPDFQSYMGRFNTVLESGQLDEQYCMQNFFAAHVLRRKFLWLRWGIVLFAAGLLAGFAVYAGM